MCNSLVKRGYFSPHWANLEYILLKVTMLANPLFSYYYFKRKHFDNGIHQLNCRER